MKKWWQHINAGEITGIITVLVVIVLAIITRQGIFSPGSLNGKSGQEFRGGVPSHLELSGQCGKCHAPPWSEDTMADRCLNCHEEVKLELQNPHELHSRVLPAGEQWSCTQSCHTEHNGTDAEITLISEEHFLREEGSFSLEGHLVKDDGFAFACVDCHPVAMDVFDEVTCVECHRSFETEFLLIHIDTFGTGCLECHDGIDTYGDTFDHNKTEFPLLGKHAALLCTDCHEEAQTISALQSAPQDCYSCHNQDDEHNGQAGQDCAQCHDADNWQLPVFDHDRTDYKLTGRHVLIFCTDCHVGDVYEGTPTDCNSCHNLDDEHQMTVPNCIQCHDTTGWSQVNFDHNLTDFQLIGEHAYAVCIECHEGNRFEPISADCYSCHDQDDIHQGTVINCNQCHNTGNWRQAIFDHNQTGYTLTGRHISLECIVCHDTLRFENISTDCYSCHRQEDRHGASETNCNTCHNTTDWRQVSYDHSRTSFSLTGRHLSINCASCHTNNIFNNISTACYSCHSQDDAHNGSFGTSCSQCHNTTAWLPANINHSQTAFPLTGAHSNLTCSSCHQGNIYAGTPTACSSCHSQDDAHNGSFGTACNQCHNTTAWLPAQYNLPHTFPVNHHGANGECAQCHVENLLSYTCYAGCHEHSPSRMANIHNDVSNFGDDCARCHPTGRH